MLNDVTILLAEDDEGHTYLITRNLERAGVTNKILHFVNGEEILDFLFSDEDGPKKNPDRSYLILLDIECRKLTA